MKLLIFSFAMLAAMFRQVGAEETVIWENPRNGDTVGGVVPISVGVIPPSDQYLVLFTGTGSDYYLQYDAGSYVSEWDSCKDTPNGPRRLGAGLSTGPGAFVDINVENGNPPESDLTVSFLPVVVERNPNSDPDCSQDEYTFKLPVEAVDHDEYCSEPAELLIEYSPIEPFSAPGPNFPSECGLFPGVSPEDLRGVIRIPYVADQVAFINLSDLWGLKGKGYRFKFIGAKYRNGAVFLTKRGAETVANGAQPAPPSTPPCCSTRRLLPPWFYPRTPIPPLQPPFFWPDLPRLPETPTTGPDFYVPKVDLPKLYDLKPDIEIKADGSLTGPIVPVDVRDVSYEGSVPGTVVTAFSKNTNEELLVRMVEQTSIAKTAAKSTLENKPQSMKLWHLGSDKKLSEVIGVTEEYLVIEDTGFYLVTVHIASNETQQQTSAGYDGDPYVYPNPTYGKTPRFVAAVHRVDPDMTLTLYLYSSDGQKLREIKKGPPNATMKGRPAYDFELDLSGIASGMLHVVATLKEGGKEYNSKIAVGNVK